VIFIFLKKPTKYIADTKATASKQDATDDIHKVRFKCTISENNLNHKN